MNLRSAVSIARRLQDPLAELVKIDPKAIGVGQYQHDMPAQAAGRGPGRRGGGLRQRRGRGREHRLPLPAAAGWRASPPPPPRISCQYREENGPFTARKQILKVPKLGPKAFEQCAGFLRVPESKNVLDNTAVHPESYAAAEKLLALTRLHPGRRGGREPGGPARPGGGLRRGARPRRRAAWACPPCGT